MINVGWIDNFCFKRALLAALGTTLGAVVYIVAALFGLNALMVKLPQVFTIIKYAGACYLMYLGFRCTKAQPPKLPTSTEAGLKEEKKIPLP